jgi:curved DNA-binding protein CbpA
LPDAPGRTPKPVPERDLSRVSLSPAEKFVLKRVDGFLTEAEIVEHSGIDGELVRKSLARLESAGLVFFEGDGRAPPPTPTPQASDSSGRMPVEKRTISSANMRATAVPVTAMATLRATGTGAELAEEEQAALTEDVDIDEPLRRRVLDLLRKLEDIDHYALLGVDAGADKRTLKRAYFELAARYHPDRYFRKRLGSFKARMETIFGRITLAHDVLTSHERREEYDAYLDEQRRARGMENILAEADAEVRRAQELAEREALALEQSRDAPPAVAVSPGTSRPVTPVATPDVGAAARREALARRLLGGRQRPSGGPMPAAKQSDGAPAPASQPPGRTSSPTTDAMDSLRRRYEGRVAQARAAQARKYMASGEEALAKGDVLGAANSFRVAMTLLPDDPALEAKSHEVQTRADEMLSETYARQAVYQEKNAQWSEAARSWTRVAHARPKDAHANERAANAVTRAGGDLHDASRMAKLACELEPQKTNYRVTLANVYMAAGLTLNARRELEAAAQMAPHDGTIQDMLKRVGRSA